MRNQGGSQKLRVYLCPHRWELFVLVFKSALSYVSQQASTVWETQAFGSFQECSQHHRTLRPAPERLLLPYSLLIIFLEPPVRGVAIEED